MMVDLVVPADVDEEALTLAVQREAQRLRWAILDGVPGVTSADDHAVIVGVEMAAVQAAFGMAAKVVADD